MPPTVTLPQIVIPDEYKTFRTDSTIIAAPTFAAMRRGVMEYAELLRTAKFSESPATDPEPAKRPVSAAAKRKMAKAQKARWAAQRKIEAAGKKKAARA